MGKRKQSKQTAVAEAPKRLKNHKTRQTPFEAPAAEDYEVEEILAKKWDKTLGGICYHVAWVGFSPDDATWEPISNLVDATSSIKAFEDKRKREEEESRLKV